VYEESLVKMANMSGVKMTPVDGGDGVVIPSGKTTIGRGPFLQVLSAVNLQLLGNL